MKEVLDYTVVYSEGTSWSTDCDTLTRRVKKLINAGWQPLGSALCIGHHMAQTMVLYTEEEFDNL